MSTTPCNTADPMQYGERDARGHFLPRNSAASQGGRARAAKLSPAERRQIARLGWQGLVEQRFNGDAARAADYIGRLGAWAAERSAYAGSPIFQPAWAHPGPLSGDQHE